MLANGLMFVIKLRERSIKENIIVSNSRKFCVVGEGHG
jgi:hypothetical protein